MVNMDYMEQESNQEIFAPYPDPAYPDPNIHQYNNNTLEEEEASPGIVFIDTLFIFFCILDLASSPMAFYLSDQKGKKRWVAPHSLLSATAHFFWSKSLSLPCLVFFTSLLLVVGKVGTLLPLE